MATFTASDMVFVRLSNPALQEYNTITWSVVESLDGARVHLQAVLPSTGNAKSISVSIEKVFHATLTMARSVPQTVASYTDLVQNAIVHHTGGDNGGQWDPSQYLNRWIPLPLLGVTTSCCDDLQVAVNW